MGMILDDGDAVAQGSMETNMGEHTVDVTGGIAKKLQSAISTVVASNGRLQVYVVQVGCESALRVMQKTEQRDIDRYTRISLKMN